MTLLLATIGTIALTGFLYVAFGTQAAGFGLVVGALMLYAVSK